MSSTSSPIPLVSPESPAAMPGVELRDGERLVWAGRPMLTGKGKELLWLYPMCLLFGVGALIGGWYFYEWAAGAGALWGIKSLGFLAAILLFGLGLLVVPLLWPLRLWRIAYALTTQRLLVREPALLVLWPRVRELGASQAGGVRLKCIWAWLPDRTGDIYYGQGVAEVMERVPRAEEVVALIHQTLVPPPGSDRSGGQPLAGSVVSEVVDRAPSL